MQHSSSDMLGGYVQHIKDATAFLIKMEKRMNDIIKQRTKLSTKQMTQIRNGELWLFANEALQYGVVDKII
jgi:ATP-dependent protease ClpP protease subunit